MSKWVQKLVSPGGAKLDREVTGQKLGRHFGVCKQEDYERTGKWQLDHTPSGSRIAWGDTRERCMQLARELKKEDQTLWGEGNYERLQETVRDSYMAARQRAWGVAPRPEEDDPNPLKEDAEVEALLATLTGFERKKMLRLTEDSGYDTVTQYCEDNVTASLVMGICMTPGCDYSTDVEPDQPGGWCEHCEAGTVLSGLYLIGLV